MSGNDDVVVKECIHLLPAAQCTLCNGRVAHQRRMAAEEARTVAYRFRAKQDGPVSCGCDVRAGDVLARLGNGNLVCEDHTP